MGDHMEPQRGRYPWCPHQDSVLADVWHDIGVPAVGTFTHGGSRYLFRWMVGDIESFSLWAYVHLTDEDYGLLSAAQGRRFRTDVSHMLASQPVVSCALADTTPCILSVHVVEGHKSVNQLALTALSYFREELTHRLAQLDETSSSVPA